MWRARGMAACAALAWSAAVVSGAVINVPGDQPTIQAAIGAAVSGMDEVVVAAGTYVENVDFNGKAITVRSTDPLDPAVVASTIIDGGGSGTVVTFDSGEGSGSVLTGFTITGGVAGSGVGGGTLVSSTTPTITHCVFLANVATSGGGIAVIGTLFDLTLSDCEFRNNRAQAGGGLFVFPLDSTLFLSITDCVFRGNVASGGSGRGGGMAVYDDLTLTIDGCTFTGNTAVCSNGGGIYEQTFNPIHVSNSAFCRNWPDDYFDFIADFGGNVFDDGCPNAVLTVGTDAPTIQAGIDLAANGDEVVLPPGTYAEQISFGGKNVTVRSSDGADVTTIDAGAPGRVVTVSTCEGAPVLQGLTITGGDVSGDGGAILAGSTSPAIIDCVITANTASGNGGGMHATSGANPTVTGSSFRGNSAAAGGGLSAAAGSDVTVTDSAFCLNTPENIAGLVTLNGLVFFSDDAECSPVLNLGACCVGGACVVTREGDCGLAGGTYQGDGSACGAGPCPASCPWDSTGDSVVGVDDFLAVLAHWGSCP